MRTRRRKRKKTSGGLGGVIFFPFRLVAAAVKISVQLLVTFIVLPFRLLGRLVNYDEPLRNQTNQHPPNRKVGPSQSNKQKARRRAPVASPIKHKRVRTKQLPALGSHDVDTLHYLYDELTPTQFELAVAQLLVKMGFQDVHRVGGANDRGIDIRCIDENGRKIVVQCKQYRPGSTVGSRDMQNFVGMASRFHRAHYGLFVTTAGFTREARIIAEGVGFELIDGYELARLSRLHSTVQSIPETETHQAPFPVPTPSAADPRMKVILALLGVVAVVWLIDQVSRDFEDSGSPPSAMRASVTATAVVLSPTASARPTKTPTSTFVSEPNVGIPAQAERTEVVVTVVLGNELLPGDQVRVLTDTYLYTGVEQPMPDTRRLPKGTILLVLGEIEQDVHGRVWWPVRLLGTSIVGYLPDFVMSAWAEGTPSPSILNAMADQSAALGTLVRIDTATPEIE
jgi:hypothetical protein